MPNNAIVSSQDVNNPSGNPIRNRSTFPYGRPMFGTYRFGEYGISDCFEVVAGDKIKHRPSQSVQTYTLGSPLMQDINLKQDAFFVPMEAILPLNWEKFFVNPVKGQDVSDDVNTVVLDFSDKLSSFFNNLRYEITSYPSGTNSHLSSEIKYLIALEMFYSNGSLMSALGKHYGDNFTIISSTIDPNRLHLHDFGHFFDYVIGLCKTKFASITVTISGVVYSVGDSAYGPRSLSWRDFICMIRDDYSWNINTYALNTGQTYNSILPVYGTDYSISNYSHEPFNFARLIAYQIACAHFYTNDKIDYVFSANLYRELIGSAIATIADSCGEYISPSGSGWFNVNGLDYMYDWCSGYFLTQILDGWSSPSYFPFLDYLRLIFGYNNSLRYLDYFTGSRSQPLAVGNVNVAVNANLVSVIDISENIMKQKFLNAINRVGNRIENYTKELFGVEMDTDYHNPLWLFHTTTSLHASDTENTGVDQLSLPNSVTSRMFGQTGNKEFSMQFDRPGIFILINYFDLTRLYCRSTDRQFFHVDRFDMFNPYMQFIGDQSIYSDELRADSSHSISFGYTGRHMEYKQRYPVCFGAFRYHLPGFAFVDDYNNARDGQPVISPSFIRSIPTEIDRFYVSLTGYSLDSYFHFIIKNMNDVSASRPMAYSPGILNG